MNAKLNQNEKVDIESINSENITVLLLTYEVQKDCPFCHDEIILKKFNNEHDAVSCAKKLCKNKEIDMTQFGCSGIIKNQGFEEGDYYYLIEVVNSEGNYIYQSVLDVANFEKYIKS